MLKITNAAKLVLHCSLVERGAPSGVAFRLSRTKDGTWLKPDRIGSGDTSYRIAGRNVVIVAKDTTRELDCHSLDVIRTDNGNQFLLRRTLRLN